MGDTKELRGDAPADLVRALDALALARDMSRNAYVLKILDEHVKFECHRINLQVAMLRDNPYLADTNRTGVAL